MFDTAGTPQMVTVTMNLMRDDKTSARAIAMSAVIAGIDFTVRLGF